jgi:cell division septation protein DedD
MRWLFLAVLSLNLVYVGWHLASDDNYQPDRLPPLKNVDTIVLLSEAERQNTAASETAEALAETPEAASEQEQVSAEAQTAATGTPAPDGQKASPPSEVVASAPASASRVEKAGESVAQVVESGPDERCFSLGPFKSIDNLGGLVRDIRDYVVKADFRSEEIVDDPLYWVYIKPAASLAQAKEFGSQLRAKKIKDFYIIRDGDKKYGISLGRFRNKASAYGLAKKVSKYGLNVLVDPMERKKTSYWLDYELAEGAVIPASLFEQYINSGEQGAITRKSSVCT